MSTQQTVPLGSIAFINPNLGAVDFDVDELVDFVPMAAVEADASVTASLEVRPYEQVKKGYTYFADGDILLAKITPCFENGKISQIRIRTAAGFGSTEFHIIRPLPDKLDARYLVHLLRQQKIRTEGERRMTGSAGQRRVPKSFLESLPVFLPPLPEQRRIAAILDKADALRAKRRQALAHLDRLAQSIFVEMFGDPIDNPRSWPTKPLGQILRVRRGGSPRPIEQFLGGTVNWIKIGDATRGDDIYLSQCKEKITEAGLKKTVFLKAGSLIFANCGVSLGFARILKIDGCIHDGWLSFDQFDEEVLNKIFLLKALNSVTERFRAMAPAGTQPNLNTEIMKNFSMMLPPIALQKAFTVKLSQLQSMKSAHESSMAELDNLFASLQHRAFRGEL